MRYIVWACFGVDADSPEQAKRAIKRVIDANTAERMDLFDRYSINPVVFVSPEFDKLIGNAIQEGE